MALVRDKQYFRLRRFWLAVMDAVLLDGLAAKLSYRLGLHGRLTVASHTIDLNRRAAMPGPLRIAFASDFHAGPQTHPALFTTLVDRLLDLKPDVVLLGGDYVSSRGRSVDVLATELRRLRPPFGIYAVLGNHDWWTDDRYIVAALQDAGVVVLINRHCPLPEPYAAVSICGIDDPWTGNADAAATFAGAGPIRVFLTHSPDGLLLLREERFDVALAGHTHGGQIALPDGTQIMTAGGPLSRKYGRGRFQVPGNGTLIVSLGIGCSNVPVRINADSELVLLTLKP